VLLPHSLTKHGPDNHVRAWLSFSAVRVALSGLDHNFDEWLQKFEVGSPSTHGILKISRNKVARLTRRWFRTFRTTCSNPFSANATRPGRLRGSCRLSFPSRPFHVRRSKRPNANLT
jgi:hypothetical protein